MLVLGIAAGLLALVLFNKDTGTDATPLEEVSVLAPISSFSWSFEEATTLNLDGQFQTNVYLLATYENNISEKKLIDTVDGSCSELPGTYEGDVSNTGKIQCYYAGLGQQYRIAAGDTSYSIERKLFEEGLPDMPLADYEWEPLTHFSLMK